MPDSKLSQALAADPDRLSRRRSHWADAALSTYQMVSYTSREEALCDLLTDLMHWADRHHFDFNAEFRRAEEHYRKETRPEGDHPPAAPATETILITQPKRNSL